MGILLYGLGLILGIVIFLFLNSVFDIYYFGFKGMASTFMGCWFAGVIIIVLLGGIAFWLAVIFLVLWLLSKLFKGGSKGTAKKSQAK